MKKTRMLLICMTLALASWRGPVEVVGQEPGGHVGGSTGDLTTATSEDFATDDVSYIVLMGANAVNGERVLYARAR